MEELVTLIEDLSNKTDIVLDKIDHIIGLLEEADTRTPTQKMEEQITLKKVQYPKK